LALGIECPEVYGDPALLLPMFFNPKVEKRFAVGLIPHYADKGHPWLERQRRDPQVRIIDVQGGIQQFVAEVKACELIVSSSLHGLICADAYGIPNAWVMFSELILGGAFKFRDYRLSIGAKDPIANIINESSSLNEIASKATIYEPKLDLLKLLLACPFLNDKLRKHIISSKEDANLSFATAMDS
jgi:pyruvyltransferase